MCGVNGCVFSVSSCVEESPSHGFAVPPLGKGANIVGRAAPSPPPDTHCTIAAA